MYEEIAEEDGGSILQNLATEEEFNLRSAILLMKGDESLSSFANRAGVSKGHLSRILNEKEKVTRPQRAFLEKLYRANPSGPVKMNDLLKAANYPEIPGDPPGILANEVKSEGINYYNASIATALTVFINYLNSFDKRDFQIEFHDGDFQVKLPDDSELYVLSAIQTSDNQGADVLKKAMKKAKAMKETNIVDLSSLYMISNSNVLANLLAIDGCDMMPFHILYTADNIFVTKENQIQTIE